MNKVALYCRSGFEKECAAEITAKAAQMEIFGFARVKEDSGYVLFECYQPEDADRLADLGPLGGEIGCDEILAQIAHMQRCGIFAQPDDTATAGKCRSAVQMQHLA